MLLWYFSHLSPKVAFIYCSATQPSLYLIFSGKSAMAREISQLVCVCLWLTVDSVSCLLQVSSSRPHHKRVKALVDCRAVSSEQLAFFKDEIIIVTASNDPHWWVSATTAFLCHSEYCVSKTKCIWYVSSPKWNAAFLLLPIGWSHRRRYSQKWDVSCQLCAQIDMRKIRAL